MEIRQARGRGLARRATPYPCSRKWGPRPPRALPTGEGAGRHRCVASHQTVNSNARLQSGWRGRQPMRPRRARSPSIEWFRSRGAGRVRLIRMDEMAVRMLDRCPLDAQSEYFTPSTSHEKHRRIPWNQARTCLFTPAHFKRSARKSAKSAPGPDRSPCSHRLSSCSSRTRSNRNGTGGHNQNHCQRTHSRVAA